MLGLWRGGNDASGGFDQDVSVGCSGGGLLKQKCRFETLRYFMYVTMVV